jgi:hypothetical protein
MTKLKSNAEHGIKILRYVNRALPQDKPATVRYMGVIKNHRHVFAYKFIFIWKNLYKGVAVSRVLVNGSRDMDELYSKAGQDVARAFLQKMESYTLQDKEQVAQYAKA